MEIERDYYLKELVDRIDNQLIKIVTGIRRCGKSYLLNIIFKNYLIEQGNDEEHIIQLKALNEYYTYGGLPLTVLGKTDNAKINYLKTQKDNVYINDIVDRNGIQNKEELEMLVQIIASDIGCLTNPLKLSNSFKERERTSSMTDKTIYNYLEHLQNAFLIERARRFDVRGKRFIETPQKYYFTDMGIRNSFLDFRQSEEISHTMENVIYIELKKRGYNVDVGSVEIREGNVRKQLEIDFVANKGNNKIYIQSALEMKTSEKVQQEQRSLLNVNDFFKKIIIVGDNVKRSRYDNGIIIMSIYDFLLDSNSLEY